MFRLVARSGVIYLILVSNKPWPSCVIKQYLDNRLGASAALKQCQYLNRLLNSNPSTEKLILSDADTIVRRALTKAARDSRNLWRDN